MKIISMLHSPYYGRAGPLTALMSVSKAHQRSLSFAHCTTTFNWSGFSSPRETDNSPLHHNKCAAHDITAQSIGRRQAHTGSCRLWNGQCSGAHSSDTETVCELIAAPRKLRIVGGRRERRDCRMYYNRNLKIASFLLCIKVDLHE